MAALRFLVLFALLWVPMAAVAGTIGPTGGVVAPAESGLDEDLFAEEEVAEVADPIEGVNRAFFTFNDRLYFWVFKPVARGWRKAPEGVRLSIARAFTNLAAPIRVANDTLQGKIGRAGGEIMRFLINSTVGLAGLFDPAARYGGLPPFPEEDFGQTLGRYGVGGGPYLVIPILGPSNARDAVGRVVDAFLDPLSYLAPPLPYTGAKGADTVNDTSLDKDTYEGIKRDSLDPYLTIRDAYDQHRRGVIRR